MLWPYHIDAAPNTTAKWHGSDQPQNANPSWTVPIDYSWNSLGFRSAEPQPDVPCLISFGCSFSVGVGLAQHMRFPDLVADRLGLAHYSFAVAGSDFLTVMKNVNAFVKNDLERLDVKQVLIQWPNDARYSWYQPASHVNRDIKSWEDKLLRRIMVPGNDTSKLWMEEFAVAWKDNVSLLYLLECMRSVDLIFSQLNIPVVQMPWLLCPYGIDDIPSLLQHKGIQHELGVVPLDLARDQHVGPKTHEMLADVFLERIKFDTSSSIR